MLMPPPCAAPHPTPLSILGLAGQIDGAEKRGFLVGGGAFPRSGSPDRAGSYKTAHPRFTGGKCLTALPLTPALSRAERQPVWRNKTSRY
jgi:hypothetical protein